MNASTTANRETWLNDIAALMAPRFAELGHPLPSFRVSVGFPSAGMNSKAVGECWNKSASADQHFEIFLRPDRADPLNVAATLAHELVHTAVGLREGHKGNFAKVALALGFTRPLTHTSENETLAAWIKPMIEAVGPMPHAPLQWRQGSGVKRGGGGMSPREDGGEGEGEEGHDSSGPKKQGTRMLKAICKTCGYTVRVTSKWLLIGPPHCPADGAMEIDMEHATGLGG